MSMNFDGVAYDRVAGWCGTEGKEDLPPHCRVGGLWWPVWDPKTYEFIPLPEGVSRVMVAIDTGMGQKLDFFYWIPEKETFSFDKAGKDLVPDQLVGYFMSWAIEPEAPQVW